jgi:hypothetical protein
VRRSLALHSLLLAALACAGCASSEGFGIDLTMTFASSVPDVAVAGVTSFTIRVSGDETGEYSFTLGRAANRTERIVYRPKLTSRNLAIDVQALGATALIAEGVQASAALLPDHITPVDITLSAPILPDASVGDMEIPVDDASGDGGIDDMAHPPTTCGTSTTSNVQLCEAFEGSLSSAWSIHSSNGTVSYDTAKAYRGNSSLHFHGEDVPANTSVDLRISETETFAPAPTDVFARAWFYLSATPANAAELFSVIESPSPYDGDTVLIANTGFFTTGDSVKNGAYTKSTTAAPLNQWFCVTFEVHVATDDTGLTAVGLNDTKIVALQVNQPTEPTDNPLGALSAGFEVYNPTAESIAFDVWMDELIVNNTPVSCER